MTTSPIYTGEISSDEEKDMPHSLSILDEWQAEASDSDKGDWGSNAYVKETFLGDPQCNGEAESSTTATTQEQEIFLNATGQRMFVPRNIRHPCSGER
ncbi:Hypothetical predicted protein [Pelobates cultripes]|uniref:Uncharacterized protein n=1 Tax=Pelobates cultripes TaxID=61616 RepID=A0AAD1RKZ9_PELCU|nr:Hypothetical predicted protein [Pelobates cultripes]